MGGVAPAACATLVACTASGPLPDTPIEGGSDEQRMLVREELREFDAAVGAGRLSIPLVRFRDIDAPAEIRRSSYRITLDTDTAPHDVRWILRHELCHGLDFEEDLVAHSPLFDELATGYFADADQTEVDAVYPTDRMRRSEALAVFCSIGALGAHSITSSCRNEPEIAAELSRWLIERVWRAHEPQDFAWEPADAVGWASEELPSEITVGSTLVPENSIRIGLDYVDSIVVDLHTAEPQVIEDDDIVYEPRPSGVDGGFLYDLSDTTVHGWPDGPAAAFGRVYLWHLGYSDLRLFVRQTGGPWMLSAPDCQLPFQQLFTADESVWIAWVDGYRVKWTPVAR